MKERAKEVKAAKSGADDTTAVLEKIAELEDSDRAMAEKLHELITRAAPDLAPRLWYGMPAYAKDGKVLCFFQPATKFKSGTRRWASTTWPRSTTARCGPAPTP